MILKVFIDHGGVITSPGISRMLRDMILKVFIDHGGVITSPGISCMGLLKVAQVYDIEGF